MSKPYPVLEIRKLANNYLKDHMSLKRVIRYPCGAALHIYTDGKRHYIPSQAYKEKRQAYLQPKQFRGKPDTPENCFNLLAAVFGYSLDKSNNPFKKQLVPEASVKLGFWRD